MKIGWFSMLIITRKPNESFIIGDNIEVVILEIQNDKIKLGINAPKNVQILRKELYETQISNQDAAESAEKIDSVELEVINKALKR